MLFGVKYCVCLLQVLTLTLAFDKSQLISETYPYHAVINSKYTCTGIIISELYVLCPAVCIGGSTWGANVYLGSTIDPYYQQDAMFDDQVQTIPSEEIIIHDRYQKLTKNVHMNNIALIKLAYPASFAENIQPAILMSKSQLFHYLSEYPVNITGWYMDEASTLNFTTGLTLNSENCVYHYGPSYLNNQQICLEWSDVPLNLAGNPVHVDGKILGFIVFTPCSSDDCENTGVVLGVSWYLRWISQVTNIPVHQLTGDNDLTEIMELKNAIDKNDERFVKIEAIFEELKNTIKDIRKEVSNSCIGWIE